MEHCQICGKGYSTPYDIPDKVWKKITPRKGEGGLLCMECAEKRAKKLGIVLFWVAKENDFEKKGNVTEKLKAALEIRKAKRFNKNLRIVK